MSMPSMPSNDSGKGFGDWIKKPENRTTAIFYAIMAFGLFWFWGLIVPFILSAAENTWQLIKVCLLISVTLWVLMSKRVHIFARVINRWITGWFVALDPIGIREDQIAQTKKRKGKSDSAVGDVRGLRSSLASRIRQNMNEYTGAMGRLKAAQSILANPNASEDNKHQAQRTVLQDSKYADDLKKLLESQQSQLVNYDDAIKKLTRMGEICDDFILRKEREIQIEKDNQTAAKSLRTVRMAMSAIFGKSGDVGQEMDDMARERLEKEYSDEMGQFDQFLSLTTDVLARADFNDLAALQDVQNKINAFESNGTKSIAAAPVSLTTTTTEKSVVEDYFK